MSNTHCTFKDSELLADSVIITKHKVFTVDGPVYNTSNTKSADIDIDKIPQDSSATQEIQISSDIKENKPKAVDISKIEAHNSAKEFYKIETDKKLGLDLKRLRILEERHSKLEQKYIRKLSTSVRKRKLAKKYQSISYRVGPTIEHGKNCHCCSSEAVVKANEKMREERWRQTRKKRTDFTPSDPSTYTFSNILFFAEVYFQ